MSLKKLMEVLEKARKKLDWTKYRLAKELGISQTSLNYFLEHPESVKIPMLLKIQELLEMPDKDFWTFVRK